MITGMHVHILVTRLHFVHCNSPYTFLRYIYAINLLTMTNTGSNILCNVSLLIPK